MDIIPGSAIESGRSDSGLSGRPRQGAGGIGYALCRADVGKNNAGCRPDSILSGKAEKNLLQPSSCPSLGDLSSYSPNF